MEFYEDLAHANSPYEVITSPSEYYLWNYYQCSRPESPPLLGPRRKRRRFMDMIDTNVPQSHPALYDFVSPYFVDQLTPPLPVAPPISTAATSSSRAPSRLSSSSSSSGDGGTSAGRARRLSSRKRSATERRVEFATFNSHLVAGTASAGGGATSHPGMPYPPPFNTFCQAAALGHACSANHVHMHPAGNMSAVPHLCCNVTMCPMQRGCPAGHASANGGSLPYPGMVYATSQSQQLHNSSAQTRHSQGMSQAMPAQPHRTTQPYMPNDMLPGSHSYRPTYGQLMAAASMDQNNRLSQQHHNSLPQHGMPLSASGARQYSSSSGGGGGGGHPGGQSTAESMASMFGVVPSELVSNGGNWTRRRMTENVTPASHLSQQNSSGRLYPSAMHPYDHFFHSARYQAHRSNQNPMSVVGPGYPYNPDMEIPAHMSEHDPQYQFLMSNMINERFTEGKPKGLTKHEIEKIRLRRFSGEKSEHGQAQCVICICDFEPKQNLRQLPCCHEFHAKCVDKWLKSNRTCPICRGDAATYSKKSKQLH